jgi:hypothetical protein
VTILRRIAKDKAFCRWLIANKTEIASKHCYVETVVKAYTSGKSIDQFQKLLEFKKKLNVSRDLRSIRELFKKDIERLFLYLEQHSISQYMYLDYLNACNYLGLDMTLPKNRYPHDFMRWHDIRIDEYHTARALADEKELMELQDKFVAIATKYSALQKSKNGYAVIIAMSPADLLNEGEALNHCVGKMNYAQKMIREETLIFFLRSARSPDTPFVTLEYSLKAKKLSQCYGKGNTRPAEPILNYINKVWLPYANRTIKKLALCA